MGDNCHGPDHSLPFAAMAITAESVTEVCRRARAASLLLPAVTTADKDAALTALARLLREQTAEILEANAVDLDAGRDAGLDDALLDRLRLDPERVEAMAVGVEAVVRSTTRSASCSSGGRSRAASRSSIARVPIGVVAIVYEARPNVTVDAAALCLKSGNAAVLRGSSSAAASNAVLVGIVKDAVAEAGLPDGTVEAVAGGGREELGELARQRDLVDLIIPRGGEGLKAALEAVAEVPILYAASGNCHVYVDAGADLEMARSIAYNAKVQRPGVCNAAETLLVHEAIAERVPPGRPRRPRRRRRRAGRRRAHPGGAPATSPSRHATGEDWDREYHGLKMAVAVVDSVEDAIDHVNRHGSGHSEAIVTGSDDAADGVHRRRRRGLRLRQRLDPLHRRLRVRHGGGDRQLDPEAACPRADRAPRADLDQVRPAGHGSDARVSRAGRRPRRRLQPAAPRPSPARPGGESRRSRLDELILVPTGAAPHKRIDPEPGPSVRLEMTRCRGRRRPRISASPTSRSDGRARLSPTVRLNCLRMSFPGAS